MVRMQAAGPEAAPSIGVEITLYKPILGPPGAEDGPQGKRFGEYKIPFGVGDLMLHTEPVTVIDPFYPMTSHKTPFDTERATQTGDEKGKSDVSTDKETDKSD